jgi:hypothetical protein
MTLPRYQTLCRHWRRHPPAHLLLASWLGAGQDKAPDSHDLGDLAAMFGVAPGGRTMIT